MVITTHLEQVPVDSSSQQPNQEETLQLLPAGQLDWVTLEKRYPIKSAFLEKICGTFLVSNQDVPERIRNAARNDPTQLTQLAHSLKGSAGSLMAPKVVECAKAVEASCRAGKADLSSEAEILALSLQAMLDEIRHRLQK